MIQEIKVTRGWTISITVGLLLACPEPAIQAREVDPELTRKAWALLQTHCSSCHSRNGKAKGGFDYVLDRGRLLARSQVVAGKAIESPLWQRIEQGEMPPPRGKTAPLKPEEQTIIQRWIDAGAAGLTTPRVSAPPPQKVSELIREDLENHEPRQRRFLRYLTLAHLAGAGVNADEFQRHRQALSKLVNSLSWNPRITVPTPIDPAETIYRVDLRDYRWNARAWDKLSASYPFRTRTPAEIDRQLSQLAGCETPVVNADWWIATASRPPFYHEFLQLPATDRALERLLNVDVAANIQDDSALRSGFNGSGVARSNRILERHDAGHGAYWRSYDFRDTVGRSNIFEHPLGPGAGNNAFQHAGGEIIFHLPNGMQAYMLVDATGSRIDRAPTEIVSDPKRPDRIVENGISCFSCHVKGLISKDDQIWPQLKKNLKVFEQGDREAIQQLYGRPGRLKNYLLEDNKRFAQALAGAGVAEGEPEPIEVVTLAYEAVVDSDRAAAEVGVSLEVLQQWIRQHPRAVRALAPLLVKGGTIQRQLFDESVPDLLQFARGGRGISIASEGDAKAVQTSPMRVICFDPRGETIVTGSEEGIVRVWNRAGKEILRLPGHRDEVTALAFAGNQLLVSAGRDRTIRVWDLQAGRQVKLLRGHTDAIRGLAVASNGKLAVSGGDDRVVRIWDLEKGEERAALTGHKGPITSVALSNDGQWALSGSPDRTVRIWNLATSKEASRLEGHRDAVHAVAFAPDSKLAASAGNDRTIVLWEVATGQVIRRLTGHRNAIVNLAFAANGSTLLSGSSQYTTPDRVVRVWNPTSGLEIASMDLAPDERVAQVAFSPDGQEIAWIDPAKGIRRQPVIAPVKDPKPSPKKSP